MPASANGPQVRRSASVNVWYKAMRACALGWDHLGLGWDAPHEGQRHFKVLLKEVVVVWLPTAVIPTTIICWQPAQQGVPVLASNAAWMAAT